MVAKPPFLKIIARCVRLPVADPGFGKGGFMCMCTVATMPPFDAHAHRCNDARPFSFLATRDHCFIGL